MTAFPVTESPGHIDEIFGMTGRTFSDCTADMYFEHMTTTLTSNDIIPKMDTPPLDCKHLPLYDKVGYLFPCLLNKARKS
jgi:hypothetical protein